MLEFDQEDRSHERLGNRHKGRGYRCNDSGMLFVSSRRECAASMDVGSRCFMASILLQAFVLPTCLCVSVRFPSQQTVYVVSGQNLVLRAEFEVPQGDQVTRVTWEQEVEGKRNAGKIITTVAEYPAWNSGGRVTVDKGGSVMTLRNYQRTDNGVYTVTVRDQKGGQSSARCTVYEYEAVHHVSIMVNVSHSSLHCMEAWGTEPVFRWLHEKVAVTEAVGRVSPDGTSLYLTTALCGHFTCIVSNKLGHSSATYTAVPCEREGRGSAVAVVCLVLLLLLAGGLAFLVWRYMNIHGTSYNTEHTYTNTHSHQEPTAGCATRNAGVTATEVRGSKNQMRTCNLQSSCQNEPNKVETWTL
ncbi:uncharacterized protein si:dkeyp-97a10.2 isoform X2 [Hemibagrus wyckioides]|uniref:uncharacterized protein si:dkeyp-97a10.2 isoform X2 n=2 Tax=Hemibagrus wyckioides TaxID=337641 RepID=UPI00266C590F|nr:uncharacterized protein si:dkeyp-97a10.2 isoform X2 [Hemibagrus wyckioides]